MSFHDAATPEDTPREHQGETDYTDSPEGQNAMDEARRDAESEADAPVRKLTRQERLQALADSGVDTWAEARGDK